MAAVPRPRRPSIPNVLAILKHDSLVSRSLFVLIMRRSPHSLLELCVMCIVRNFRRYKTLALPDELALKVIRLLIKRRYLDDTTLLPLLTPHLRHIDLSGSESANISKILLRCPNVEYVSLRGCLSLSDITLNQLAMHCSRIIGLNISYNKKISDEGVLSIARRCTRLLDIDLSWCRRITDRSLVSIAQNCTLLDKVNLSRCRSITGKGIMDLVSACSQLKSLELKGCTSIDEIHLKSFSLTNLNFSGCENLSEDSVAILSCPSLLTLSVSTATPVTDFAINKVLVASPRLQGIDVSGCSVASADFSSHAISSLNLSSCKFLTELLFQRLPQYCPHLQRIELRDCDSVTDEYLRHLSRCPSLQYVDVSRCSRITDTGTALLVKHDSQLKHLDISWCPLLTERTLEFISACLRGVPYGSGSNISVSSRSALALSSSAMVSQIRCLKVFGCAGMRAEVVDAFKGRFPYVEFRYANAPRDWANLESI